MFLTGIAEWQVDARALCMRNNPEVNVATTISWGFKPNMDAIGFLQGFDADTISDVLLGGISTGSIPW